MRKKLALVCALLHDPPVLLFDEPTNGLDPHATRDCLDLLRERAARGGTVLVSTHLLDQAERLVARVGILDHGRLKAVGPLDALRADLAPGGTLEDVFFRVTEGKDP
jgi:ABC-2 type transport system ATP-binding protein